MSSKYAPPIRIIDAIENIVARKYLLPAIQRKFVWSADQIEVLFDSILRGYPVNSFMFWAITEDSVKNKFQFFEFLTYYREFFHDDNYAIDTRGLQDFYAVIDGQQRLTAIYLGLKGSYAYKLPRKWLKDNEENMPTRWLYINLSKPLPADNERQMKYDIRFLTAEDYDFLSKNQDDYWFKLNDILKYRTPVSFQKFLLTQPWNDNEFVLETLSTLWNSIFVDEIINFYLEETQDIDAVLDIFIRTNSGGEPLSFSNLLMSITTANWNRNDGDARKAIKDTKNLVFAIGNPGFQISEDFILKTCLVLFNDNIKFQIRNFDRKTVNVFEENWDRIQSSIIAAFQLLAGWGFNDSSLRAKNAVIPIIYYIFHNNLENLINKQTKYEEQKKLIRKWLSISLLKGVFGSHSDSVLTNIRKVLLLHQGDCVFPFEEIKEAFKSDASKSLSFDDDFIEGLLTTQKDSPDCYPLLALLYNNKKFDIDNKYDKDHLHPEACIKRLKRSECADDRTYEFYKDKSNWNSIVNLQLLTPEQNRSKQDKSLKEWIDVNQIDLGEQLIPKDADLDFEQFEQFICKRRELLKTRLREML